MNCPNCHSDNREGAKYCNECGFPLSGRIAAAAAAAASSEEEDLSFLRQGGAADAVLPQSQGEAAAPVSWRAGDDDALASEAAPFPADALAGGASLPACDHEDEVVFALPSMEDGEEDLPSAPFVPPAQAATSDPLDPPPSPAAATSGPLDPARVPCIEVAGVNVDEDGNAFDFSPLGEADDLAAQANAPAARTADLSGIECLVDEAYVPPMASWRTGDTKEMPRVEGEAPRTQREFRAPDPNERPRHRALKVVIVVVVLLALAAAAAAVASYRMELWGGKMLPDVVGKSQADATYMLENKGFSVRATYVKSDDVEGIVLLMDPSAGSRKDEGAEVVIHVSVARTVPDVVGKSQADAVALFAEEEFTHVSYETVKSNEPEGTVLSVSPEAGTKVKAAAPIVVEVAESYVVPDVAGAAQGDGVQALEAAGYVASVSLVYTEDVKAGTVVSTDPVAGTKLASGSTVVLLVAKSRAAELVDVTWSYLQSSKTFSVGGTSYEVVSIGDVQFAGNGSTSYSMTAKPFTTFLGETIYLSDRIVSGTITWGDDNSIVSASPTIKTL